MPSEGLSISSDDAKGLLVVDSSVGPGGFLVAEGLLGHVDDSDVLLITPAHNPIKGSEYIL